MRWSWWISGVVHAGLLAGAAACGVGNLPPRPEPPMVFEATVARRPQLLSRSMRRVFHEKALPEPAVEFLPVRREPPPEREDISEPREPRRPGEPARPLPEIPEALALPAEKSAAPVPTDRSQVLTPVPSGWNPPPRYPPMARRLGLQGTVTVRLLVSPAGEVASARIEASSGSRLLDGAALVALRRWRFAPGRRGNVPVAAEVMIPVEFRLRKER